MAVVSISLPDDLVADMDAAIALGEYQGRSEYLRAAVRAFLLHRPPGENRHIHGSITVTYAHGREAKISEVRHAFHDVVLSMMHTHCEAELCMDVLLVGGAAGRVQQLADTLQRMRDVSRSHLAIMA